MAAQRIKPGETGWICDKHGTMWDVYRCAGCEELHDDHGHIDECDCGASLCPDCADENSGMLGECDECYSKHRCPDCHEIYCQCHKQCDCPYCEKKEAGR